MSPPIKLNVGGTVFQTSRSTLIKYDCMFRGLLESGIPLETDESGCVFIDRDPTHFRHILNFMRDGTVELPENQKEIKEILNEAQFYLIQELIDFCKCHNRPSKIVKLNVGGTVFETKRSTLIKHDCMFRGMLEKGVSLQTDKLGCPCIFIDRDPTHFRYILNFMRDGTVELPKDKKEFKEILKEAKYYSIPELVFFCKLTFPRFPPRDLKEIQEILKEAEYYSIQELIDLCRSHVGIEKPDYLIAKSSEDMMKILMEATTQEVVVIFYPERSGQEELLHPRAREFVQDHKHQMLIVFKSDSVNHRYSFEYHTLRSTFSSLKCLPDFDGTGSDPSCFFNQLEYFLKITYSDDELLTYSVSEEHGDSNETTFEPIGPF